MGLAPAQNILEGLHFRFKAVRFFAKVLPCENYLYLVLEVLAEKSKPWIGCHWKYTSSKGDFNPKGHLTHGKVWAATLNPKP